jgi:hypothetical protein
MQHCDVTRNIYEVFRPIFTIYIVFHLKIEILLKKSDGRSIFIARVHPLTLFKVQRFRNRAEGIFSHS